MTKTETLQSLSHWGMHNVSNQEAVEELLEYCKTSVGMKAKKFDQNNPKVWELFVKFATEMLLSGHTKYSISALTERIRLQTYNKTKISNSYRAYYARKLMAHDSKFDKFFVITKG